LIPRKIIKTAAPDVIFYRKMHQIRFRLGLCPRPRWGSLQRPPDPLAGFKWPTSKGRGEKGWDGTGGAGGEGREKERRDKGEGKEGSKVTPPPPLKKS